MKFPKLVIEEAKNLKKFATEAEINNLTFDNFDPENKHNCIYGKMTGSCFSPRAEELIQNSCSCVYHITVNTNNKVSDGVKLNGKPSGKRANESMFSREIFYYSPIEVFISRRASNPDYAKKLIRFIKGKIKTL